MTDKPKIEGMATKKGAVSKFSGTYKTLAKELAKEEKRNAVKGDSVSKKRISEIKSKMNDAKADFFDSNDDWSNYPMQHMPRWIQDLAGAPLSLRGMPPPKVNKRGGGMVGSNKIIKGYKKGGQV